MQWSPFLPWYPVYGVLFILLAILAAIWFILHVEKARQLSWLKLIVAILILVLSSGLGLHLILYGLGI